MRRRPKVVASIIVSLAAVLFFVSAWQGVAERPSVAGGWPNPLTVQFQPDSVQDV